MKAIILAAGIGSRLRPLTNDKPKCMVKLLDETLIESYNFSSGHGFQVETVNK